MIDFFSLMLFLLMVLCFTELIMGFRKLESLEHSKTWEGPEKKLISVIIPACNEEKSIGEALRSVCLQEYTNLEIIVVNDRSTDGTAAEIASVCLDYPQIKSIHIESLPDSWLGKPHALQRGADLATGEYLLFCDADVCLEQTTISRAIRVMTEKSIDHLALLFRNKTSGWLLNALITDAGAGLLLLFKPWKVNEPKSRFFIGVGAFNMVRTSVYHQVGGHERIRMQVVDDIFLGKLIKRKGFSQVCLQGEKYVSVPWYYSISEMVSGLMKNVYGLFDYRPVFAMIAMLAVFLAVILPYLGVIFTDGVAQRLFMATVLVRIAVIGVGMVGAGVSPGALLFLPITPFISLFIIGKAMITAHREGGISWRNTFYSLSELRKAEWVLAGFFSHISKSKP